MDILAAVGAVGTVGNSARGQLTDRGIAAPSFPSGVGTSGKIKKRTPTSFEGFFHRLHTTSVSTALAYNPDRLARRTDAQTESMDTREALRGRDGNNPRQGIHIGHREKASGFRWVDSPLAGAVFPGRKSCLGNGGERQESKRDPGAESSDRRTPTGDRGAIGGDTFFKKNLQGVHLSWTLVEQARVEASLPVIRAINLLGLSRTSYYRQVRGMKDYRLRGRGRSSSEHRILLGEVALKRPEAGHRKVRLYAIAWDRLRTDCEGSSRMSCYRQLKSQGLIQPGRPAHHFKEVRQRRRELLAIPTSLNQVLQGDFTDYETEDGETYNIGCFIEYLSRFNLVSRVLDTETALDLISVTEAAIKEIEDSGHQLPTRIVIVTDNGPAMKSKTYRNFIAKNTTLIHVRGQKYHPQTIGREERFHGSLKIERLYRTLPRNRAELVAEVESYRRFYNFERLHQSLGYLTPAQVYFKATALENSYLSSR
jgi:putative transposase